MLLFTEIPVSIQNLPRMFPAYWYSLVSFGLKLATKGWFHILVSWSFSHPVPKENKNVPWWNLSIDQQKFVSWFAYWLRGNHSLTIWHKGTRNMSLLRINAAMVTIQFSWLKVNKYKCLNFNKGSQFYDSFHIHHSQTGFLLRRHLNCKINKSC